MPFGPREQYLPEMKKALGERCTWTAMDASEGVDLKGKTMVVTGANSGIGTDTVRTLVKRGATVYATARSKDKLEELVKELGAEQLKVLELELCSFKKVDEFVQQMRSLNLKLDAFINNAGTMANPFKMTDDNFEMQMQANYLSVTRIVSGLLEYGLMKDSGRIVVVSTCGHLNGDVPVEEANWNDEGKYNKWLNYFVSKGFVIMYCNYMAAKLQEAGKKITVNSLHPGGIMTNLARDLTPEDYKAFGDVIDEEGKPHPAFKTIPEGAATSVWAAVSSELEGKSGLYLENCSITPKDKIGEMSVTGGSRSPAYLTNGLKPYIFNTERQATLVKKTEELLGRKVTGGL